MRRSNASLFGAILFVLFTLTSYTAAAAPTAYQFTVTGTTGPLAGVTSVGTLSFDPAIVPDGEGYVFTAGVFTFLSFSWDGIDYDETTANTGSLGFAADGTLFHALFGTDCGPSGFGCGVGTRPADWMIGFDEGSGFFIYKSPSDPSDNYYGVVSLTLLAIPTTKQQCMEGGWKTLDGPEGPFKNQGDCIQFVNTGK